MEGQLTNLDQRSKGLNSGRRRVMFFVFEESEFIEEILAFHAPDDDAVQVDVAPILGVIETILQLSALNNNIDVVIEDKTGSIAVGSDGKMLQALAVIIHKICFEFSCKCSGDIHTTTMAILKILGSYSWEAKVVIALAAFAVTYGELWLVMLLGMADHPLAKSIALLKQTPDLSEINGVQNSQFKILNELVEVIVDVVKSLVECRLISSKNDAMDSQIANATYWCIRSIITCGAHISGTIGVSGLKGTSEAWDLSSLVHKLQSIHDLLLQLFTLFSQLSGDSDGGKGKKRVSLYQFTVPGN